MQNVLFRLSATPGAIRWAGRPHGADTDAVLTELGLTGPDIDGPAHRGRPVTPGRPLPLTWLYVPGDRPEVVAKALRSGADVVIVDLEDAVAPDRKEYARAATAELLSDPQPVPVHVRINALDGPLADRRPRGPRRPPRPLGPAAPQGRHPPRTVACGWPRRGSAPGVPLYALLESALGMEHAYAIATAHPALHGIALGEADLRADLGVRDDAGLDWPRSRVVVAARAAGLAPPAQSVYPDIRDLDALAALLRPRPRPGLPGPRGHPPPPAPGDRTRLPPHPGGDRGGRGDRQGRGHATRAPRPSRTAVSSTRRWCGATAPCADGRAGARRPAPGIRGPLAGRQQRRSRGRRGTTGAPSGAPRPTTRHVLSMEVVPRSGPSSLGLGVSSALESASRVGHRPASVSASPAPGRPRRRPRLRTGPQPTALADSSGPGPARRSPRARAASAPRARCTITARTKTTIEVQSLRRRPRMWWASSTRRYSIQARPDAVGGDVERECPAMAEPEAPVGPDDQPRDAEAPQRLVQESRMVVALHPAVVADGDLQRPGQVGRPAVQLLVEPVAPAADRLRERDAGRDGVGERRQRDAAPAAGDPGAHRAERDGAPDAEPALPDREGVDQSRPWTEVLLLVGDHVVEPGTDQAEGHGPDGDVGDRAGSPPRATQRLLPYQTAAKTPMMMQKA